MERDTESALESEEGKDSLLVLVIIQLILESQVALSMKMGPRTSQIKGRTRRKTQM